MTLTPGPGTPDADDAEAAGPLAFLVGTWRGEGVGGFPGIDDFQYGQEVTFSATGKPVLAYSSRSWWLMNYYIFFPQTLPANQTTGPVEAGR